MELGAGDAAVGSSEPTSSTPAVQAPAGEAAPDHAALSVVERVRAKLAAKQQNDTSNEPAAGLGGQPNAAPSTPSKQAPTLKEQLAAHNALDWLVEQGVDVVALYDALDQRANTPAQLRPVIDQIMALRGEHEREIAALKAAEDRRVQEQQTAEQRAAVREFYGHVAANASKYPFLAAETPEEQLSRAVSAATMLRDAGEAGTAEEICALAEDLVREQVARYPGVSLGQQQKPAVGAGQQGAAHVAPSTLTGSIASETSAPAARPRRGSREWREQLAERARQLTGAE